VKVSSRAVVQLSEAVMNKYIFLGLLFCVPVIAQVNGLGYVVDIHVTASRIASNCGVFRGDSSCKATQEITVDIDGKKYELQSETFFPKGIVALGDYKAKLLDEQTKPTGEFTRTYDLQFPDQSKRKFHVIGQME
jgi:hypothetical protein